MRLVVVKCPSPCVRSRTVLIGWRGGGTKVSVECRLRGGGRSKSGEQSGNYHANVLPCRAGIIRVNYRRGNPLQVRNRGISVFEV